MKRLNYKMTKHTHTHTHTHTHCSQNKNVLDWYKKTRDFLQGLD